MKWVYRKEDFVGEHENREAKFEGVGRPSFVEPPQDERQVPTDYSPPQIFVVGKAVDLVQSYSSGKYSDGYTGYYWER